MRSFEVGRRAARFIAVIQTIACHGNLTRSTDAMRRRFTMIRAYLLGALRMGIRNACARVISCVLITRRSATVGRRSYAAAAVSMSSHLRRVLKGMLQEAAALL